MTEPAGDAAALLVELKLLAPEAQVEAVSELLMEHGALSVSVEDADAQTAAEHALFGEPGMPPPAAGWQRSTLAALFPTEAQATAAATLLLAHDSAGALKMQSLQPVAAQDWVRLTQSQFAPVDIAPGFWIVPSWHAPPPGATQVLRLDPGLAFGTGTHPTTRMCLRWIAAHPDAIAGAQVLDYGCGSGILAIAAALHGAAAITAVDIDPAALRATADNAAANGLPAAGCLRCGPPELAGPAVGAFGTVLANILATPLKLLAPLLSAHVAPGGHLVLAGILARQADELRAAYAPHLALTVADEEDGWILMTGGRAT